MNKKRIELSSLIEFLGNSVLKVYGKIDGCFIDHLADVAHVDDTTLDWVGTTNPHKQQVAESSKAKVILVDAEVNYSDIIKTSSKTLIVVDNPKRCLAQIGNRYFAEKPTPGIHPTAIIHPDAIIGEKVFIGPYTVVGNAKIGDGCVIDSNVHIYDNVIVGDCCIIKSGAVLGGEGFGFEKDAEGNRFRFPQLGRLIIGNNVEVGANSCIDRGALSDTVIGDNTKVDNLCHIAHNNYIGSNCVFTAGSIVSGSCEIGNNTWVGPNSTVNNWCKIGSDSLIGIGTVVIRKIKDGARVFGVPAETIDF